MDDGEWHRAKIIEIEENFAFVFLGDHGDDDNASLDKIKILEPQFRRLPAQVRTNRILSLSRDVKICLNLSQLKE